MKAVVVREPGGPEALEYADVPDPEIGPDDVDTWADVARLRAGSIDPTPRAERT